MQFINTISKYGLISKLFHWVTLSFLIVQIPLGLYLVEMEFSEDRINLENIHVNLGLIIFYIILIRLIWKILNPKPFLNYNSFPGQVYLAKINHFLLYICLISVPISGILKKLYTGEKLNLFFTKIKLAETNFELSDFFYQLHILSNYILILLIIIHIFAVIVHHVIFKDKILKKML